ncbi:taste receptor type 2 member 40-like [Latimeria chalumnae]|uniref:taste receptor type 2 member 40-like n=1 Tax=Latimeria chalumnae TaxID=7897 RepID=UPI0003C0FD86|nr:PREDICTED: taste receptor type 2 member 40-like [Latimeria chalumnae]|eukprot:XP_006012162.1 PREDICTED: taste receptor type 2 member 40-like [Latimeria chalumnae]
MATTDAITQLVVELVIMLFGLGGNSFIVCVYVMEYQRSKALLPTEVIVTILAIFNILIQLNLVLWFVVYLFNLCTHFGEVFYQVTDFNAIFLSKSSYWFTAWLCFFYCVKIVKVNWRVLMRLKQKMTSVVHILILASLMLSFSVAVPIIYRVKFRKNATSISELCKLYYDTGGESGYIYGAMMSLLTSFLPLAVMVISSMGIVIFLCRHSRNMTKRGNTGGSSHTDAHTAVALMLLCLIVLYIICTSTVLSANLQIALSQFDVLLAISFTSSIYSAGSSVILIIGTVKLKQSCGKLCCSGG